MPSAEDLEAAVLGAIMLERDALETVISDFSEGLFYNQSNRLVAKAIMQLFNENEIIDILTVSNRLKTNRDLVSVGGHYYVAQLTARVASTANIDYHVKILQQKYLGRYVVEKCQKTTNKILRYDGDVFDIYAELQAELDDALKSVMRYEISDVNKIHQALIKESLDVANSGGASGVPTGLRMVDNLTNGWQKTDLIIVAGRPGMGKTALAVSLALYPSVEQNKPIAIFSLEMSKKQLMGRMQSFYSEIDVSRIVKKQLDVSEIRHIETSCQKLNKAPLYIDDTPNISLIELKSKCRKLVREKHIEMIVIDYLQLMRSGLDIQSREQEVSAISRGLKSLAKELDVPIIALSQLARAVEQSQDKKPMLSHLRESGSIEQDADMVIFCYRPEYYKIETYEIGNESMSTAGLFMAIIEKHRNGALGEIPLRFIAEQTKITGRAGDNFQDFEKNKSVNSEKPTALQPNIDFGKDESPF